LDQYLLMLLGDEEDGNAHPYRDEFEEQWRAKVFLGAVVLYIL
jgi:hypothetical protein